MKVNSWQQFAKKIKSRPAPLLLKLADFNNPLLVTGCQRSGTTLVTELFMKSSHFVDYQQSDDSELDGAMILSGHISPKKPGRYCFQTTYLNERFPEYYDHTHFKMLYIIRKPASVIYSMCHHWGSRLRLTNFALNELFLACADKTLLSSRERFLFNLFGCYGISTLRRACLSYHGKLEQLFEFQKTFPKKIMVLDYDDIIQHKEQTVSKIFAFASVDMPEQTLNRIHNRSISRAKRLTKKEKTVIDSTCLPIYERALKLAIKP